MIHTIVLSNITAFSQKNCGATIPTRITISDDGVVVSQGKEFMLAGQVANVAMVLDMGEWYHLSWSRRFGSGHFVCQKSLLVKGTIEDFEKLFEGKIVRKNG